MQTNPDTPTKIPEPAFAGSGIFLLTTRRILLGVDKMAYQIRYGQTMTKQPIRERKKAGKKTPALKWIALCLALLVVVFLGNSGYLDFLIPGDNAVTTAAFESMVTHVREGVTVRDAFTEFCLQILNGAQANG